MSMLNEKLDTFFRMFPDILNLTKIGDTVNLDAVIPGGDPITVICIDNRKRYYEDLRFSYVIQCDDFNWVVVVEVHETRKGNLLRFPEVWMLRGDVDDLDAILGFETSLVEAHELHDSIR